MFIVFLVFMIRVTLNSVKNRKSVLPIYMKLLLNHLHLIILVASFELDWPAQVKQFFSTSRSLADAPSQVFSVDCFLADSSISMVPRFYVYLLLYFCIPFIIAAVSCFTWGLCLKPRCSFTSKRDKAIASVVILLFLFHPMITTVIFQSFYCTEIDHTLRLVEQLD